MQRHRNSTRNEILNLIRKSPVTTEQLSEQIGITPAGIRSHLNFLEQEGLVMRREVIRRGAGQPSIVFAATTASEDIDSSAYKPILIALLECLSEFVSEKELQKIMTKVGKKLAAGQSFSSYELEDKILKTMEALNDLGGLLEMAPADGGVKLTSYACPLAAAVKCRPQVCSAVRAFIAETTKCKVTESCKRAYAPLICEFMLVESDSSRSL